MSLKNQILIVTEPNGNTIDTERTKIDTITPYGNLTTLVDIVAPYASTDSVNVAFLLANGNIVPERMATLKELDVDVEGNNAWQYAIPQSVLSAASQDGFTTMDIQITNKDIQNNPLNTAENKIGTFTDLATLNIQVPIGDVNDYATLLDTGTIANWDGLEWIDSGLKEIILILNVVNVPVSLERGFQTDAEPIDINQTDLILDQVNTNTGDIKDLQGAVVGGTNLQGAVELYSDLPINATTPIGDAYVVSDGSENPEPEWVNVPNVTYRNDGTVWESLGTIFAIPEQDGTVAQGTQSQANYALTQDIPNKSDKVDTGLFADLLQSIKDIIAASGNTDETIANSINAIFPLIEAGAGDMLKAIYATLEVGKVDKAIQDSIGNVIHTFYATKAESDLKQDITDALLATDEKEIVPAINELKSDLGTTDQNVEDNLSAITAEKVRNDNQDAAITNLDNVKIEGVIIEDDGVEIATDIKTINAGGGLGIINDGAGKVTIQSQAQVLASSEQELDNPPLIELPVGEGNEIKLDFAIKKDSSDDERITVDINGDLVLVEPGDYDLNLTSLWLNNNTSVKQIIKVNVHLNDELGDPLNIVVDEAIGPGDPESTAFTPSRFRTQAQIEDAIAGAVPPFNDFPVTLKFFVSSDNTGSDLGVFDLAIKNFGSTGGSGGDMFKTTYDQNNNGVVDDADYDPTGDDIISGGAIVQSLAIKELDAQAFANKTLSEENKVKADNNTTNKQAKVPGDLNTTAASTSGGINENKARIDNNDTEKINRDGTIPMTGDLDMGMNHIGNLASPVSDLQATRKLYVDNADALKVNKAGDTMGGPLSMGNFKITSLGTPASGDEATNKTYVDGVVDGKLNKSGDTMSGTLNMDNNRINGLPTPVSNNESANKEYVDTSIAESGGILITTSIAKGGSLQDDRLIGKAFVLFGRTTSTPGLKSNGIAFNGANDWYAITTTNDIYVVTFDNVTGTVTLDISSVSSINRIATL